MIKHFIFLFFLVVVKMVVAQSTNPWLIEAKSIDPNNYFGVTVANGMVGLVSSPEPMKVREVVLNGVYDYYQRGRVSNILKTFNHVNMNLDVDGRRIGIKDVTNYKQVLDMKRATLITTFDVGDKISVKHSLMSLRHLPYTAMSMVEIMAKKAVKITPMSVIEAPNHLADVRNTYSEIDRPHVKLSLLSSVGKSPSGKHTIAASNSIIFSEPHGQEPILIHEDWDYNMHLAKFNKTLKAGETYSFSVVSSATSTEHYQDPMNEAERLTIFARLEGTERLLQRHLAEWEKLWKSDIVIEGDVQAQKDVRFALYHLYSFVREGTGY
ncbi:MAG: glycoside hydrolase family 65 protein, partial [Cytophagales bacterium]